MSAPLGPNGRNRWLVDDATCDLRREHAPRPVSLPAAPQDVVLDLARTAILVIDMQNDFCHPDGWLASIGVDVGPARAPIEPLQRLLPALRDAEVPVVFVNWGTRPDRANLPPGVLHVYDPDGRSTGIGAAMSRGRVLQEGTWSAALVEELVPEPADLHVSKHRMSGFWDTPLESILRNLDVTTLLLAGVNADQCVLATLIDAACIGYDCILLTDCSATTSPSFCWDATVYNVRQCFGFTADGADLVEALG